MTNAILPELREEVARAIRTYFATDIAAGIVADAAIAATLAWVEREKK